MHTLSDFLSDLGPTASVLRFDLSICRPLVLDFSNANSELAHLDLGDTPAFAAWIEEHLAAEKSAVAVGRYGEDRVIYRHSPLFDGASERRSVHLGIDLFAAAGTTVFAPLDGVVHSFADNNGIGDYGPTVIVEHDINNFRFWTLYGHLARTALDELHFGQKLEAGAQIATLGNLHENGAWPPHLHFQIITDIGGFQGNYPGVAAPSERSIWLERCPDPNLILQIPDLEPGYRASSPIRLKTTI